MKKILFTGFEPFDKDLTNPSWDAVSMLPDQIGDIQIVKRRMPVEYDTVADLLSRAIEEEQPDAVLCVGQAGGRAKLTPEVVAINLKDASIPDNAGVSCAGEPICPDGPAAYFATVPVKAMAAAMSRAGVPSSVSYTAGTYVCNCLMYQLLHLLQQHSPQTPGGFIHIPYSCEQALSRSCATPSLPLELMAKGLEAAAAAVGQALEEGRGDIREATGNTH
jgi:pyroglutamyl-peptidase